MNRPKSRPSQPTVPESPVTTPDRLASGIDYGHSFLLQQMHQLTGDVASVRTSVEHLTSQVTRLIDKHEASQKDLDTKLVELEKTGAYMRGALKVATVVFVILGGVLGWVGTRLADRTTVNFTPPPSQSAPPPGTGASGP